MRRPETNAERLITFTDGVAAIAITLLVLPLVDLVPEASAKGERLGTMFLDHRAEIVAFVVSFAVIARLWWAHHQIYRHVEVISTRLVFESLVWTFTIVVLPLPTAVITAYSTSPATLTLYIGTLIVSSGALTSAALDLRQHPELSTGRTPMQRSGVLGAALTLAAFCLALLLGLLVPGVGFWAMLLAAVTNWVQAPIERRWARKDAEHDTAGDETDAPTGQAATTAGAPVPGDNGYSAAAEPES